MKTTLACMLMALATPWLASTTAAAVEDGAPVVKKRIRMVAPASAGASVDGQAAGEMKIVVAHAGEGGTWTTTEGEPQQIQVEVAGDGDQGQRNVIRVRRTAESDADAAQRGWLGVMVRHSSSSSNDGSEESATGVVVDNVVKESPADRAGLVVGDVIVGIDSEVIDEALSDFVNAIKSRNPGDTVQVRVVREGKELVVPVVLGSRADMPEPEFRATLPRVELGEIEDHIRTRGKLIQRGPSGEWIMKDFGDLKALAELPEEVRNLLPDTHSVSTQVFVTEEGTKVRTHTESDGSSLTVEREAEGPIVVTRVSADGQTGTQSFATVEDLKAGDAEAHELFSRTDHMVMIELDGDADGDGFKFLHGDGSFDIELNLDDLHTGLMQWHSAMGDDLAEVHESFQKAMDELRGAMDQLRNQGILSEEGLAGLSRMLDQDGPVAAFHMPRTSETRRTIRAMPDGTIEVRTRAGGDELVDVYANEADLQARNADAYARYVELLNAQAPAGR